MPFVLPLCCNSMDPVKLEQVNIFTIFFLYHLPLYVKNLLFTTAIFIMADYPKDSEFRNGKKQNCRRIWTGGFPYPVVHLVFPTYVHPDTEIPDLYSATILLQTIQIMKFLKYLVLIFTDVIFSSTELSKARSSISIQAYPSYLMSVSAEIYLVQFKKHCVQGSKIMNK